MKQPLNRNRTAVPLSCLAALLLALPVHAQPVPQAAATAQANAALDAKDFPKAVELLTPLAAANPGDARILYDLAFAQESLDRNAAAEAGYRLSAADDPAWIEPRLALGLLLARAGNSVQARVELLAASVIPTVRSEDNALKARAFRALARLDQTANPPRTAAAGDELLSAMKLSPETPDDIQLAADLAVQDKQYPEAELAYRRLLNLTPQDPTATAALAHVLLLANKAAEAEPLLTSALVQHPGDSALIAELAAVDNAQGKLPQAIAMVEQLRAARPGDANVDRLLAHLYLQSGDYARAEPIFAALSRKSPQDFTLVDDRADALLHLRRFAESEALLQKIVAQPSGFATSQDFASAASHLAFAASENDDPATALRAVALRDTVLPPAPMPVFLAAISADKLHQVKQAHERYEQFLSLSQGKFPDQEWQARHRLIALDHMK
jgi:Flp pilus assembly protein TadD